MDLTESDVQSFIVKLWFEGTAEVDRRRLSHGYVTHVSSGERRYVQGLDDVTEFIVEHLEKAGVEVGKRWRMTLWSKRRARRRKREE
jgi:ribosomal protein S19E (S16A)